MYLILAPKPQKCHQLIIYYSIPKIKFVTNLFLLNNESAKKKNREQKMFSLNLIFLPTFSMPRHKQQTVRKS